MIAEFWQRLDDEVRRACLFWWLAAGVALVVFSAGFLYVARLPNLYDAWGQIYVDKETPVSVAAQGLSSVGGGPDASSFVQHTLLNDATLERVVRKIEPGAERLGKVELAGEIDRLRKRIRVVSDGPDGFVEFHYTDTDPIRARSAVEALLDRFIASNVDRGHRDLSRAELFLDDQLAAYRSLLSASQAKLASLQARHSELATLSSAPLDTPATAQGGAVDPPASAPEPFHPSAAAQRLANLQEKLTSLRTIYTDQHPDVLSLRRQIAEAKQELDGEQTLAPKEVHAARLLGGAAGARHTPRLRRLQPLPPEVVAEWKDAQHSDEALRIRYQELVTRREAAGMSQAVYGPDGSGKFEVTRAPETPYVPTGPNRRLYLAAAAVVAIASGLAAAYGWGAIRGLVISPREVATAFQLPVVASVSRSPAWARKGAAAAWPALTDARSRNSARPFQLGSDADGRGL